VGLKVEHERVFAHRGSDMRSHEQMTVRAADIAERIVDEISQSDQDWSAIEDHARKLVELLARRASGRATPLVTRPTRPRARR
jgi:hypothetical protein